MKKRILTLLATVISSTLYSQQSLAQSLAAQCQANIPVYQRPLVQGSADDLPVTIDADHVQGDYPTHAVFSGDVDIRQGNRRLQADSVQLQQKIFAATTPHRIVQASGHVRYDDNQIIINGPKAWINLTSKDTTVWDGKYQMVGRQGHGEAQLMQQRDNNRYTILQHGNFTSCLPRANTWSVAGSKVVLDRQEQVAEIWNARFMVGSVPVFYSPYLQLPVGDKRRSGFLLPNAKYSTTNSFEFSLPYYWNIAPNFDATLTPHYIHQRGNVQWQTEFRYLIHAGSGTVELDYLPSDKTPQPDSAQNPHHSRRWLLYWKHSGVLDSTWRFNADYTRVSDLRYFNDFDSQYGSSTDGYATQKFSIAYAVRNFDATLSTSQFQLFDTSNNPSAWRAEPQLDFNFYHNDLGPFDTRIYGQAVRFNNSNHHFPQAIRLHLEPVIGLPLSSQWGSLNTEARLLATHYQQNNLAKYRAYTHNNAAAMTLKESVNRVMPQFKIDGKMVFERDLSVHNGYTQTLEPHLQYLYVPYRNQESINNYDSSLLQFDYSGLFRDRSYGGLDRIASANQLTAGVTSRFYDANATEHFNFSLGQIYYFNQPRVGDDNIIADHNLTNGSLVWSGDMWWRINDLWGLRGGMQYDGRLSSVSTGSAAIEYRRGEDRMLQFNYRYASPRYTQATLPIYASAKQYKDGISQAGVSASWPIKEHWSLVGAYYYDTNARQPADQMVGVQYSSCCYAIRVGYERKINGWDRDHSKYDNVMGFNIELRGLSTYYGLGTQEMLRSNILPWQSAL